MVLDESICLMVVLLLCMSVWPLVYSKVQVITFMSSHVGVNFAAHFLCVWAAGSFQLRFIIHGWGEPELLLCGLEPMFYASYTQLRLDTYTLGPQLLAIKYVSCWPICQFEGLCAHQNHLNKELPLGKRVTEMLNQWEQRMAWQVETRWPNDSQRERWVWLVALAPKLLAQHGTTASEANNTEEIFGSSMAYMSTMCYVAPKYCHAFTCIVDQVSKVAHALHSGRFFCMPTVAYYEKLHGNISPLIILTCTATHLWLVPVSCQHHGQSWASYKEAHL